MTIWIINPYGSLPGEGWRDYRSTLIANAFNKCGHQVVWFVSNFEHRSKKFRSEGWKEIQVNDRYKIILVPSSSYEGHISLDRIKSERRYAFNLKDRLLRSEDKPDLVIIAEPAIFTSDILIKILRKKGARFIVDIIDLWPELFNILLPSSLTKLGKVFFAPFYWRRSWLLKKANGLIAVAQDYLEIGKKYNTTPYTEVIYWGIDTNSIRNAKNSRFESEKLNEQVKKEGEKWVIYAGTLGENYDLNTIIKCGETLEKSDLNVRVLIAGDGSLRPFVERSIAEKGLTKTIYLGRLSANDLDQLYKNCDIALSSYVKHSTVSMSVKTYDYLAAGLPLVNSLGRDLGNFVTTKGIGIQYKPENSKSMFEAIKTIATNAEVAKQMRENAFALSYFFDSEVQYGKLVTLAERLVNEV